MPAASRCARHAAEILPIEDKDLAKMDKEEVKRKRDLRKMEDDTSDLNDSGQCGSVSIGNNNSGNQSGSNRAAPRDNDGHRDRKRSSTPPAAATRAAGQKQTRRKPMKLRHALIRTAAALVAVAASAIAAAADKDDFELRAENCVPAPRAPRSRTRRVQQGD